MLKSFQIIGCSAGVPTHDRGVSSLLISTYNYDIMIDCGEGTYLRWKKAKYKWKNLKYIFVTHMHPDHTGGLIPLLFYRKLSSIKQPLTIIGPPQLEKFVIDSFKYLGMNNIPNNNYINISKCPNLILQNKIKVKSLNMEHKIPCWGYRIEDNSKSIVFITDTLASLNAIILAKETDILIHEATFNHKMKSKAKEYFHTTNIQAMEIADKAKVKRLVLTHFSTRLSDSDLKDWIWNGQPCVIFDKRQNFDKTS